MNMGRSGGNILKWVTIPPLFAFITVGAVRFLSDPELAVPVDPSIWAMTMLLFVVMSALYCLFIIRGMGVGLIALQALAQGMLLCPLALGRGAYMIQWIGVILAASGASALVSMYHQSQSRLAGAAAQSRDTEESNLPVPFAVTDETGKILNISSAMLKIAGLTRESVAGQSITLLLEPGETVTELGGKMWDVRQEPMEGGRYYFQIMEPSAPAASPAVDGGGAEAADEGAPREDGEQAAPLYDPSALIDPVTRLHTFNYAMSRMEEELYRTKRYGHPMTAALFRIAFPDDAERDGSAQAAFDAYCSVLRKGLRASDTAALASRRSILLVFSECTRGASDLVMQRLLAFVNSLCPNFPILYDITALHVSLSFEGTDNLPDAEGLLQRLNNIMSQKYSLQVGA